MRNLLCGFAANDEGAAAIEYGLLAAGIAVAIIAVIAATSAGMARRMWTGLYLSVRYRLTC